MISIIIYARDRENDVSDTYSTVLRACIISNVGSYEIVLIDDFSKDSTLLRMQNLAADNRFTSVYQTEVGSGINAAILTGFARSTGEIIFPIPGHNMFDSEAIAKVLRFSHDKKIVLGYRENLLKSRPPIKYLSSRLLLKFYKRMIYKDITDIHGLNSYPRDLIEKSTNFKLGHGFHMIPITLGVSFDYEIIQVPIAVNPHHKNRSSKKLKDNWPSFKSILAVAQQLLISLEIKKNIASK